MKCDSCSYERDHDGTVKFNQAVEGGQALLWDTAFLVVKRYPFVERGVSGSVTGVSIGRFGGCICIIPKENRTVMSSIFPEARPQMLISSLSIILTDPYPFA